MAKLFVVSELFYPEQTATAFVMTKIVNKLSEKYDDIEVIKGTAVYDKNANPHSGYFIEKNVKLTVVKSIDAEKNSIVARSARFILLSLSMFKTLLTKVKPGDKVLIVTNPAPIVILMYMLKKIKKIQLVILVHDVFPENTIPGGILKSKHSIIYKILLPLFNRAYAAADKLIVVGRDMKEVLHSKIRKSNKHPNISVIENWSEDESVYPKPYSNEKLVFQFAGNLGRVQGLIDLIKVIREVKNDYLEFHFVGDGAVKNEMIEFASANNMNNVVFKDAYRREEQTDVLNACDIAIVTLSEGMFGLGVPSKSYNVLAAGKPILYIGDQESEIDLMVRENKIGFNFSKAEDLVTFFNEITPASKSQFQNMGKIARQLAETRYSQKYILEKYKAEI